MSEWSKLTYEERTPTRGRLRGVLYLVTERHTETPAMRVPGQIGGVLIQFSHDYTPEDFARPYAPSPTVIEDTRTGMDSDGNWHCPRTDPDDLLKTELNRWQYEEES